jgi:Ca2+-binding EF-hand superfamily protein
MKNRLFRLVVVALPALGGFVISPDARADNPPEGKPHGGGEFRMMDTNGDGKISAEEHAAGAKMMFEKMDADKDGKVTPAEMDAAHERMGKMMGMAHKPAHMEMSSADKMKVVDTNHDGVLSADEHAAGAKMMFEKMDTDKDGYLTKAEMEAGHAKMMSKMSKMSKTPEMAPEKGSPKTPDK